MPELPEVETITKGLAEVLPGRKVKDAEIRLPKIFLTDSADNVGLRGAKVTTVWRRGKLIVVELSSGMSLVVHLKMTGQLIYREKSGIKLAGGHPTKDMVTAELPGKATHVVFQFDDGSKLYFNDLRQFGYVKLLPTEDVATLPLMHNYGPEPLGPDFTLEWFEQALVRRSRAKLKVLLVDQSFIAGIGNIYASEALNLAKLHPLREAGSLKKPEIKALHEAIVKVLKTSLKYGGTSDNTYVTIRGEKGDYLNHARVYHRTNEPCLACGTPISRMVVAGRGTFYCPKCQRAPRKAAA